ncbi:MAG TPA: response regulator transcription factor [Oligoflexia bacterium]|nr:response regulator transcription factor [Oligoflexia bacterium]HMP49790.1 response regulator transcription factor [Oligoflexia bacterium]
MNEIQEKELNKCSETSAKSSGKPCRVILADDHELVRTGIRMLLEKRNDIEVVAETKNGLDTIDAVDKFKPDLLILDIQMPNLGGMEVLQRLSKIENSTKVLIVSATEPGQFAAEAFSKGADGYLLKDSGQEELDYAISSIQAGKKYISPTIAEHLVNPISGGVIANLSNREKEVFKLLAEGKKNKEIAKILFVSQRTIDTHRLNIMRKLGANTNSELTQLAIRNGIL